MNIPASCRCVPARAFGALALVFVLLSLLTALPARRVEAHPADEATVGHYVWLEIKPGQLSLQHASTVGGLLTQAVWPQIDRDGNNELSQAEQEAHARHLAEGLLLRIDGKPVHWKLQSYEYPSHEEFFTGGFPAIKLLLTAPLPAVGAQGHDIEFRDETFPHFRGVFPQPVLRPQGLSTGEPQVEEDGRHLQVQVLPAGSPAVATANAPAPFGERPTAASEASPKRISGNRLPGLALSPDPARPPLRNPLAETRKPDPLAGIDLKNAPLFPERGKILYAGPREKPNASRRLRDYLNGPIGPGLLLLALGAAFVAGMAHALTPGHGKAMVGAYLVGSRGTVWDAVLLGLVVTITHTAGVYLLGALCLWLTSRLPAETVGQWLSVVSGLLVLGMGFWLFQRGLLAYHGIRPMPGHSHGPGGHIHGEHHEHADFEEIAGTSLPTHEHSHAGHGHSHAGGHSHEHGGPRADRQIAAAEGRRPPRDSPLEDYGSGASADAERNERGRDRWSLIGLGLAGGIVPCFDALAILIAAVNLRRVGLGLAMIGAFSLGMAAVLVAIGVLMVTAKSLMRRFSGESRWIKALPAVSGAILFFLGAWLTLESLAEAGVLHLG